MTNSEEFIVLFNRIDNFLKNLQSKENHESFSKMVKRAAKSNAIIRQYKDDLIEFAELRNAIVHDHRNPPAIAEIHEYIVKEIRVIEEKLTKPKMVIPDFQREVKTFQVNDSLSDLLVVIRDKHYSQFPVYDGGEFKGLITENGIANWLAKNMIESQNSLKETCLTEVLNDEEETHTYKFINRNTSVYEAEEIFKQRLNEGIKLAALLITHSGKRNESLLGMITPWDLINI